MDKPRIRPHKLGVGLMAYECRGLGVKGYGATPDAALQAWQREGGMLCMLGDGRPPRTKWWRTDLARLTYAALAAGAAGAVISSVGAWL